VSTSPKPSPGDDIVTQFYGPQAAQTAAPAPRQTTDTSVENLFYSVDRTLEDAYDLRSRELRLETGLTIGDEAADRTAFTAMVKQLGMRGSDAQLLYDHWSNERMRLAKPASLDEAAETQAARDALHHEETRQWRQDLANLYGEPEAEAITQEAERVAMQNGTLRRIVQTGEVGRKRAVMDMLAEHVRRQRMERRLR
jgi:hypothetical protein